LNIKISIPLLCLQLQHIDKITKVCYNFLGNFKIRVTKKIKMRTQNSCPTVETYALSPVEPGSETILADPSIRGEVDQAVREAVVPSMAGLVAPNSVAGQMVSDLGSMLDAAAVIGVDKTKLAVFKGRAMASAAAVQRGEVADRLLGSTTEKGLGCVACTSSVICPVYDSLKKISHEANLAKKVFSGLKGQVAELEGSLEKKLLSQGFSLPSGSEMINFLTTRGFMPARTKGSHTTMTLSKEDGSSLSTVVAVHGNKPIPFGTFRGILKQAGIPLVDYVRATR
jgi:predicted RNA binding protein YcfA (HicA-like mRNA interferase family)